MSSKGVSGIPNSAPGGQFGTSDKNVVALKIKPNNPFELEGVLLPLAADKGLVFPYTPTLQVGHATNYGTYDITHTIYQPQYYVSTPVVVRSINYTMPEDVNYVECEYGVIPTMMLIAVELSVQMSPRTVRKDFNINSYAKGGLLGGGNTGGFM